MAQRSLWQWKFGVARFDLKILCYIFEYLKIKNLNIGSLGAMYYFGLGCKRDLEAAYECLTNSSERGNIFSMGLLCDYYYRNKFYIKTCELSEK